jgi:hypothetical protein
MTQRVVVVGATLGRDLLRRPDSAATAAAR